MLSSGAGRLLKTTAIQHAEALSRLSLVAGPVTRYFASGTDSSVLSVKNSQEFTTLIKDLNGRVIAPIYEQLSKEHTDVKFLKVDIDTPELQDTVNDHGIAGVPTFVFYKNGRRVESFSGARPDYLKSLLEKHKGSGQ